LEIDFMTGIRLRSCVGAMRAQFALATAILFCSALVAKSDYRLGVDDVLEISVAGIPDLKQRVMVQADGTISFPLLGVVKVARLLPSEAQTKIQTGLAAKVFRQRAPDGRETTVIIEADQVTATVADYRPIFVNGDVSKPGQQSYRPRMTVREAVALSGGYDLMRFRMDRNPFMESSDLRSEYEAQWTRFLKEQVRAWRIRTELGQQAEFDKSMLTQVPIGRSTIASIVSLENDQLDARKADFDREKDYLNGVVKQTSEHVKVVSEQLKKEEEGLRVDEQDLQRVSDLFGKGNTPIMRVTDARRALLLSSTRKLQTASQLMQLQKQSADVSRQLQHLDDQRKIDLLNDLQEGSVRLSEIRSKLRSIDEKLQYTGTVKSQLTRGGGPKPEILVVRRTDDGRERIVADEDFDLQPGDVVEVSLREPAGDLSLSSK
jgi:polysaccharide biosynthesis/export protein